MYIDLYVKCLLFLSNFNEKLGFAWQIFEKHADVKLIKWSVGSLQTIGMAKRHTAWTFRPCHEMPGTCHTTKMVSSPLVLITHFAAEIMFIAFLNQGCERPSSGFKCHLTADVAECIRWIYALSWHINGGTNTRYFWDDNTLSSDQQPAEDCY